MATRPAKLSKSQEWAEATKVPFLDDAPMVGPPSCTAADFHTPRIRRCPFDLDTIRWRRQLGEGLDGCT